MLHPERDDIQYSLSEAEENHGEEHPDWKILELGSMNSVELFRAAADKLNISMLIATTRTGSVS